MHRHLGMFRVTLGCQHRLTLFCFSSLDFSHLVAISGWKLEVHPPGKLATLKRLPSCSYRSNRAY
jgi:hypothetical protein